MHATSFTYGEVHDYTVNVGSSSRVPTALLHGRGRGHVEHRDILLHVHRIDV